MISEHQHTRQPGTRLNEALVFEVALLNLTQGKKKGKKEKGRLWLVEKHLHILYTTSFTCCNVMV